MGYTSVYMSVLSKQWRKVNRQFIIMDLAFKLCYTIKTTTSCVVHRYNANANTRNTHVNHENANVRTSASTRSGKKYSCTAIALLFTHANLDNANTNGKVRWKNRASLVPCHYGFMKKTWTVSVYPVFLPCIWIGCAKVVCIPANFFWDISVRVLSWECWDFWRRHDHFWRFPKKSEVFRRSPNSSEDVRSLPKTSEVCRRQSFHLLFTSKIRDRGEGIVIYSFYTWFSFFTWVWVNIFLEIVPSKTATTHIFQSGVRSKFSTRRCETHA